MQLKEYDVPSCVSTFRLKISDCFKYFIIVSVTYKYIKTRIIQLYWKLMFQVIWLLLLLIKYIVQECRTLLMLSFEREELSYYNPRWPKYGIHDQKF